VPESEPEPGPALVPEPVLERVPEPDSDPGPEPRFKPKPEPRAYPAAAQSPESDPEPRPRAQPWPWALSPRTQAKSGQMLLLFEAGGTVYDYGIKLSPISISSGRRS
jgi:hypothetical protein